MKTKTVLILNCHIEVEYDEEEWRVSRELGDSHSALLDKLLHDYYDTEVCDLIYTNKG